MDTLVNLTQQMSTGTFFGALALFLLTIVGIFVFLYASKSEELSELQAKQKKLLRSFNELDEQAKIIVKTDLELNKAQEELDRRLDALNSLQITSREISKTLDQQEIFGKLNQALFNDLGFAKAIVINNQKKSGPTIQMHTGFTETKLDEIMNVTDVDDHFKKALSEGTTFSSLSSTQQTKTKIIQLFEVEHFILAPILAQNTVLGILFVGNRYDAPPVTEGDEEMVIILASQIGQALDNAQLFEEVYRSRQLLESKVKDRTQQLEKVLKEVEQISQKKSEFISAVSHELRTPLTSIKGYASILMTGKIGIIPDAVKDRLAKINTHSDNLVNLINNLLDIARIESGRVELKIKRQNIRPIIENVADLLTPQLKDKGVYFKNEIPTTIPDIFADGHQIERVLINLISNAIKFTSENGTITVSAEEHADKKEVVFSVTDTGIGISDEDQKKLFDEFFRVDNEINLSVKGTGLGLALVKNIVEAHHGRIWLSSKLNEGTTFYFSMPTQERATQTQEPIS